MSITAVIMRLENSTEISLDWIVYTSISFFFDMLCIVSARIDSCPSIKPKYGVTDVKEDDPWTRHG